MPGVRDRLTPPARSKSVGPGLTPEATVITSVTCSWCHTLTADRYCPTCGHRADAARLDCDCASCRTGRSVYEKSRQMGNVNSIIDYLTRNED